MLCGGELGSTGGDVGGAVDGADDGVDGRVAGCGVLALGGPLLSPWALAVAPLWSRPLRTVFQYSHPSELIPALGATARVVALYGGLLALGLGLG